MEKRRFQALYREAKGLGYGVRPAIRMALRRMSGEVTTRIEAAMKETAGS